MARTAPLLAVAFLVGFGCGDGGGSESESEAESEGSCANGSVCCPDQTTCDEGERCQIELMTGTYACVRDDECAEFRRCGALCCPSGSRCDGQTSTCPLADIFPDGDALDPYIETREFAASACTLADAEGPCLGGAGARRLLRFTTRTPNIGDGDLYMGRPQDAPDVYTYSPCHAHYHFESYARYTLLAEDTKAVGVGGKRAFCLLDFGPNGSSSGPGQYTCDLQGISRGWYDEYDAGLDCQWIDITGLPAGAYTLRVELNVEGAIAEIDYSNNTVDVPVTVPQDTCPSGCRTDADCCPDGCGGDGYCDHCGASWDDDCESCDNASDLDCPGFTTCPSGCTGWDDECCVDGDPCGFASDGYCDCDGKLPWDATDCAACGCAL